MQEAYTIANDFDEIMIIGGSKIFEEGMKDATRMYITKIHATFKADTYFPAFSDSIWELSSKEYHKKDEKNPYDYTFLEYKKHKA